MRPRELAQETAQGRKENGSRFPLAVSLPQGATNPTARVSVYRTSGHQRFTAQSGRV